MNTLMRTFIVGTIVLLLYGCGPATRSKQFVPKKSTERQFIDLSVTVEPYGPEPDKIIVKNLGYLNHDGSKIFLGDFVAIAFTTDPGECYIQKLSGIVPAPGKETIITIGKDKMYMHLGNQALVGWKVRINMDKWWRDETGELPYIANNEILWGIKQNNCY
jgi:hypothetical protein